MNVKRDYAGGMGVADPALRDTYGHDADSIALPYMSLLYSAAVVEQAGYPVTFIDAQADKSIPEAVEIELGRLEEIFSSADALEGLSSLGRKRPEYKGK